MSYSVHVSQSISAVSTSKFRLGLSKQTKEIVSRCKITLYIYSNIIFWAVIFLSNVLYKNLFEVAGPGL